MQTLGGSRLASVARSLSARLLVLTLVFVMLGEVLIYVPSIARYRLVYLQERLAAAQLAALALEAAPDLNISEELEEDLLRQAQVSAVVMERPDSRLLVLRDDMPAAIDATYDLREATPASLIRDAFVTMGMPGRVIRVIDEAADRPHTLVDVVLREGPLRTGMFDYSGRILTLSLVLSFITAALVFISLHLLLVRPMRRITENMVVFRVDPEGIDNVIVPSDRGDEIGLAQRELAAMQTELRTALHHKTRLAELGEAVSKINHDLRNILATAQLVSDRLAVSGDPEVRRVTPTLVAAIDRAVDLCSQTLQFGRTTEPEPRRTTFALDELVTDVGTALGLSSQGVPAWRCEVPAGLEVFADRNQMYRALMNLGRNAVEALRGTGDGEIVITAASEDGRVVIDVIDNGPGLPAGARDNLFKPFKGSARSGGTGLGLAIARDLLRAHGGDIALRRTGEDGTTFRLSLPASRADALARPPARLAGRS